MNEYEINTDIISTTIVTIDSRNIPTSTGKVIINNVEVTDIDSWNKAISTFSELENKINNLQSKIDKAIDKLERLLPMCIMPNNMLIHGTEKAKAIEETLDILKEDK